MLFKQFKNGFQKCQMCQAKDTETVYEIMYKHLELSASLYLATATSPQSCCTSFLAILTIISPAIFDRAACVLDPFCIVHMVLFTFDLCLLNVTTGDLKW